ncbi:MAG: ABC transporter permease, partial [Tissierellia bacterium]|nr:ABC transporter permease [Tissierellia bacterium]
TLEQGLIYAILAMGLFISFKILNTPDLTVEGSFPFGALLTASLILRGVNPILATILATILGVIPGMFSAILAIKLKIMELLAGILTMTMMYSINLRLNGKPNVPFTKSKNIFTLIDLGNSYLNKIVILLIIVVLLKLILDRFFKTKMGYMLITTGDNETLVSALGESANKYRIIGLGMANGLVALSGSLFAQSLKFGDTQMGLGVLVIALASIIIGDTLFRGRNISGTSRAIMGAIVYKDIGTLAIEAGLSPHDLKLINGIIVIGFIAYNNSYIHIKNQLLGESKDVRDKKLEKGI